MDLIKPILWKRKPILILFIILFFNNNVVAVENIIDNKDDKDKKFIESKTSIFK